MEACGGAIKGEYVSIDSPNWTTERVINASRFHPGGPFEHPMTSKERMTRAWSDLTELFSIPYSSTFSFDTWWWRVRFSAVKRWSVENLNVVATMACKMMRSASSRLASPKRELSVV